MEVRPSPGGPSTGSTFVRRGKAYGPYAAAVFLAALTLAVYWQVGGHRMLAYDDDKYVYGNPNVRAGLGIEGVAWALSSTHASNWHPLTWISHMADVSLFGMNDGAHHLVNLLFHVANTLLLFAVLRRMTGKTLESGFAAALFAVHPLHVESVAWLAERKDVLSAFFMLLAAYAYAGYAERPSAGRYLAVAGLFAAGLAAKPMIVTFPILLLLLDFWPLGRTGAAGGSSGSVSGRFPPASRGSLVLEKVPLFLLSAASCAVTWAAQQQGGAVGNLEHFPLWSRSANALLSCAGYLLKTAWPFSLAVFYPHPGLSVSLWKAAGAGVLLLASTALVLRSARRLPWLAVGWAWYLATLLPVIGLVQVGMQAMADRYTYIPLIGIFVAATWGIAGILEGRGERVRRIAAGLSAAVLLALATAAWFQAGHWYDTVSLFRHALSVTRDNWVARLNLGYALERAGRPSEAVLQYRQALRLAPEVAYVHNNLGNALLATGNPEEAVFHFREALRIRPDYAYARGNLENALRRMGQTVALPR